MSASTSKTDPAKEQLVQYLKIASSLEHCLLNAYLFAACSLKSTFQEFGNDTKRAVYFERVRQWKQTILEVAREEMLHLHYVQSLLRGLGERPCFELPPVENGAWVIPSWEPVLEGQKIDEMRVPINPLDLKTMHMFVLYESTDTLQNAGAPFDPETLAKFKQLFQFELQIFLEDIFHQNNLTPEAQKAIKNLFSEATLQTVTNDVISALNQVKDVPKFRSIGDFYQQLVAPLYEQAFAFGWVKQDNQNLNNEIGLRDAPTQAAEGFLPVAPIYRSKNFDKQNQQNMQDPLRGYKRAKDIINEIVAEGEGFSGFLKYAQELLKVTPQKYYELLHSANPPEVVVKGEQLRQSHLYRFAAILAEYQEITVANPKFTPYREPIPHQDKTLWLSSLAAELPQQFNSAYLTLVSWLSRMYEIKDWTADKNRRGAIEMLASWPLMSLAIRPMLELASLVLDQKQRSHLFRWDLVADKPPHASQLLQLYKGQTRNQEVNDKMDFMALRVLEDVALWAQDKVDELDSWFSNHPSAVSDLKKQDPQIEWKFSVIRTRLKALFTLKEFKAQFPFREAGGYSNSDPDRNYILSHKDNNKYSETPFGPTWDQAFVLRLRFGGWARCNLATDPDPPTDESGCTGTLMLNATDVNTGTPALDRSLQWQLRPDQKSRIVAPKVGVNLKDATLMVADGASASLIPVSVEQSSGAVQASGAQCSVEVSGFYPLTGLTPDPKWNVELLSKDGVAPYLNGENHLISKDGEPIDPFIFALELGDQEWFHCEVFNEGKSLKEMEPYQRACTRRWPVGLYNWSATMPDWVKQSVLTEKEKALFTDASFPRNYLNDRRKSLSDQLNSILQNAGSSNIDDVVSLAGRLRRVSVPRGTTFAWLMYQCDYAHTLSGKFESNANFSANTILGQLQQKTGLQLQLQSPTRDPAPNSRWLIHYSLAAMDTDALSNLIYGEIYIPLKVTTGNQPLKFDKLVSSPLLQVPSVAPGLVKIAEQQLEAAWKAAGATIQGSGPDFKANVAQLGAVDVSLHFRDDKKAIEVSHKFAPKNSNEAVAAGLKIAHVVDSFVQALQSQLTIGNVNVA